MTEEDIKRLREHHDCVQDRRNEDLRESVAFKRWLYERAQDATKACKARMETITGGAR